MLGIYVTPVVVLCCTTHGCYSVEHDIACCAKCYTANATLTLPRTRLLAHQLTQQQPNTPTNSLTLGGLVVPQGIPKV